MIRTVNFVSSFSLPSHMGGKVQAEQRQSIQIRTLSVRVKEHLNLVRALLTPSVSLLTVSRNSIPVHSKFNVPNWTNYLRDYPDKVEVYSLQFGWSLNFQGQFIPESTFQNHPSAVRNPEVLRNYVEKELRLHCIICPFRCNPFDVSCVISPSMCVPKRDSADFRIIHDQSFPEYGSVNSGIPKDSYLSEDFKLRLPGVDRLVSFILSKRHGCKIFKRDLRRALRQIAVDPRDIRLLGFQVDNQIYFHCVLPFGGRSCVLCCQRTTKSVVYILEKKTPVLTYTLTISLVQKRLS